MGLSGKMAAAIAVFGLFAGQAQAACWTQDEVAAAKIRDMETMLMVSSLRCRIQGVNFIDDYNRFVRSSRPALTAVNDRLRGHFVAAVGAAKALNAYDGYVTRIANRYGGGAAGLDCRDMKSILSAANAEGGSLAGLERLSRDAGVEPELSGGRCPRSVAAR